MVALAPERGSRETQTHAEHSAEIERSLPADRTGPKAIWHRELEDLARRANQLLLSEIEFIPSKDFERHGQLEVIECLAEKWTVARSNSHAATEHADWDGMGRLPAYIASLYRTTLLEREEEQELFRVMNYSKFRANQLRCRLDVENVDADLVLEIERWLSIASRTRDQLIQANLRLVVALAKRFVDTANTLGELISDGNVTLIRAIEKFDYTRGTRFSTYGTYAVRRTIYRASLKRREQRARFAIAEGDYMESQPEVRSSHSEVSEAYAVLRATLDELLDRLSPRERLIISARFGLAAANTTEEKPVTFEQLGRELGICKERVRQILVRALEKLKAWSGHDLEDWITEENV